MRSLIVISICVAVARFLARDVRIAGDDAAAPELDESRWLPQVEAFEARDREQPPAPGAILFVGSSSIERWDLSGSFPDWPTLNRGIGGTDVSTVVHYAQRLITPYEPKVVVLYAGDNDLSRGKSPEQVAEDFSALAAILRERLPQSTLVYIGIKPSLARWGLIEQVRSANALIQQVCDADERLFFVDVDAAMLNAEGTPRPELFVEDGLHLSAEGYALWNELATPVIAEALALAESQTLPASPLSVEDALAEFRLHPGLEIEIVAAEPDVIDPVSIAFDPRGRMWVVEYRDYPNGPAPGEAPQCLIRILSDDDRDGRFENPITFADELLFCNSLMLWRDGALVTSDGKLLFLRDTNGDDVADERVPWFEGFATENPQLRANHPTFAIDNHIYIANGLRNGTVAGVREDWPHDGPVSISGQDFRFDPMTGEYESVSGYGQFGLCFDDWGNRFECSNRNPCIHVVMDGNLLARNPAVVVPSVLHDVSPAAEASRLYPISRSWTTSTLHANQFTAACGVTIYRGNGLPIKFLGNSFTCDPTGNLVHCDVVTPSGATFTSTPLQEGTEFLASRDEWFRPVNLTVGPDGCLYVVDMYRAVIEHPEYMPDELRTRPDLTLGDDRGRIWRIRSADRDIERSPFDLAAMSNDELIEVLAHPNVWQHETAHRLLYERHDPNCVEPLKRSLTVGVRAQARAHALWLLHGMDSLPADILLQGLRDPSPRVAEQAVKILAATSLNDDRMIEAIKELASTTLDIKLRFECLLASPPGAFEVDELASQLMAAESDIWLARAVGLAAAPEKDFAVTLLWSLLMQATYGHVTPETWMEYAQWVGRAGDPVASAAILPESINRMHRLESESIGLLTSLLSGHKSRGQGLEELLEHLVQTDRESVMSFIENGCTTVSDTTLAPRRRLDALALLEFDPSPRAAGTLRDLALDDSNQELQVAAIDIVARNTAITDVDWLVEGFRQQTPGIRRARLNALFTTESRLHTLLAAVEAGDIPITEIDPVRQQQLLQHGNEAIRTKAGELIALATPADRKEVLAEYEACLSGESDPQRGRLVFSRNCATCHQVGGVGVNVAPDIGDTRTKTPLQLLTDILDPNRAIDNNYFGYSVVDLEGRIHTGVIASETPTSITLKQPEGKVVTFQRSEIEELQSTGLSLMPTALERNITQQEMADLISFLKNWRYLDGQVPEEVIR